MIIEILGYLVLAKILYEIGWFVFVFFIRAPASFKKYEGEWAVITGASWGIGYGFAVELAKRGVNTVLISRTQARLEEVAKELETNYKIKTKIIVRELGTNHQDYKDVFEQCKDIPVSILINNVGVSTKVLTPFVDMTSEDMDNQAVINIESQNHMTKLFLPLFLQKKKGLIISLSSVSSYSHSPYLSVYASTKSYNRKLSEELWLENYGTGVEFLAVCPGFVTSKMTGIRKSSMFIPSELRCASDTLDKVGFYYKAINPYWPHYLQQKIGEYIPYIEWPALKMSKQVREQQLAALSKKAAAASTKKTE